MSRKKNQKEAKNDLPPPFGENLSFAAAEAYKLLRTNLLFALPKQQSCRVVGITSSESGEGKSTTALNLSYSIAQAGYWVLLVEADLRLPTIAKRLSLRSAPGLTNLLIGTAKGDVKAVVQESGIHKRLLLLSSGDIPPNPSELLGSKQMRMLMDALKERFHFIILDLPPVNEVSDALVASRWTDGVLLVVRQHYTSKRAVDEAMRQVSFAGAKILGFVMTDSDILSKGGKRYYKKGYYGYGYGYGQRPSGTETKKPEETEKPPPDNAK